MDAMANITKIAAAEQAISIYISKCEIQTSKTNTSYMGGFADIFNYYDPLELARAYQSLLQQYRQSPLQQQIILYSLLTEPEPDLNEAVANALGNRSSDLPKDIANSQTDLKNEIEAALKTLGKDFNELTKKVIKPMHTHAKNGLRAADKQFVEVNKYLTGLTATRKNSVSSKSA